MNQIEGTFKGASGTNIYYHAWLPEGDVKAVLMVVHGLAEHCGRYMNVVNHFVPLGYAVYGLDHYGHGKSEGQRVFVERFGEFTDTLKTFFDMIQGWQPGKKVFIVGHSMGGLITTAYLLDHQKELAGAVISAPSIKIGESISPVMVFMGKILSSISPRAGLMALEAGGVSRDPEVVKAYVNDPLVFTGKMTYRLGAEMIKAMKRVGAEMGKITLPLIIVQGSADKLVDPSGSKMLYENVKSADKTFKLYDGLYHEVFNEPEREVVLGDVEKWLSAHV
jgi:acylglycerol lipase